MSRLRLTILISLLSSCSILEDTDVTSILEVSNLKLASIYVTETLNGNASTQTAKVTEEVINDPLNPNLNKRITISWPAFSNPKFQFRSGVNTSITLVSEYLSSGKIKFWRVKSAEIEYETYEFRYNGSGVLEFLITTIKDKTTGALIVNDIDMYDTNNLFFPTMRNPYAADLSIKASFGDDEPVTTNSCGFKFVWQTVWDATAKDWQNKKEYNSCDKDNFYIMNKIGGAGAEGGRTQFKVIMTELLEEVFIGETQSSGTCCLDKYYFHPYLFMKGDFRIKIMYAPDWWKEDTKISGGANQSVKIKFNYEQ